MVRSPGTATRFPRSAATHRIRVVAAGYQAKERLVSFTDNVMLDLSLTPLLSDPAAARDHGSGKRHEAAPARHLPASSWT